MAEDPPPFDLPRANDFAALTREEIEARFAENGLVIIPAGSVEQHGRHLPVGTDAYAVRSIADRVAVALDGVVVPFTPLGVTPLHADIAGAINLRSETYMALFRDVCESLIRHGADRVVVVNWHEVNASTIETAAIRLQADHPDVRFVIGQAHVVAKELYADVHDLTHGGPLEALPVLGDHPELVHLDRATDPSDETHAARMDAVRRNPRAYPIIPDVRVMYPTGWYGDLDGVSEEGGREFLDRVAAATAEDIEAAFEAMADVEFEFE